jgi:hypothetical protein
LSIINYSATRRLLTIARGHPYERDAFAGLFETLADFDVCHVEQPLAQRLLGPGAADEFDAIVCYDMPGVDFTAADAPRLVEPGAGFKEDFLAMLDAGIGLVFMHHAIASWPAWPKFAEIIGARFHYRPGTLRGEHWPDSGYRHEVRHQLRKAGEHPVTAGLPEEFEMVDELYLCPVFEEDVIPLLRSDFDFRDDNFYSAARAVAGDMYSRDGWSHPPGSDFVAWATRRGNSPIVYLQGGDDSAAMGDTHFRRLVENAVRWVSSEDAHRWAREGTGA